VILHFYSEPLAAIGGSTSSLASELVQDSLLPRPSVLFREVLQNSWDQRLNPDTPTSGIDFYIDVFSVTQSKKDLLLEILSDPGLGNDPLEMEELTDVKEIEILAFADSGTRGLYGPLSATEDVPGNFADFFFVYGRRKDKGSEKDGGSRGTGRVTLNNASKYGAFLAYSQFLENGNLKYRLMGMANGKEFNFQGSRFTGRHWWGKEGESGPKPIEGMEARNLARALEMTDYLGTDTGLVVFIIGNRFVLESEDFDPDYEDHEKSVAVRETCLDELCSAAQLYAWPHMVGINGSPTVHFHFQVDHEEYELPPIEETPVIQSFATCYNWLVNGDRSAEGIANAKEITFKTDGRQEKLGDLAWMNLPLTTDDTELDEIGAISRAAIALIRGVNFVVMYLPVAQVTDRIVTRGVFRVSPEFDAVFRESEPATHDEWIGGRLGQPKRMNPVKQALDQIQRSFQLLVSDESNAETGKPAVVAAKVIGQFMSGLAMTGKRGSGSSGSGSGGDNKGSSTQGALIPVGKPKIVDRRDGLYTADFKFRFAPSGDQAEVTLKFKPLIIVEGGSAELNPPLGAFSPSIKNIEALGRDWSNTRELKLSEVMEDVLITVSIIGQEGLAVSCKHDVMD